MSKSELLNRLARDGDERRLLARLEDPTGEGRVTLLPREIKGLDLTESAWPFCPAA